MAKQNPCEKCEGKCCRLNVELSTYDIGRITTKLEEDKKKIDFVFITDALDNEFGFRVGSQKLRFILKRNKDGTCIFFDKNRKLGCTVESVKPCICIAYPFEIKKRKAVIRPDVKCPAKIKALWKPSEKDAKGIYECNWEWDRYSEIIDDWNSRAKGNETIEDFTGFALAEMQAISNPATEFLRKIRRWMLKH